MALLHWAKHRDGRVPTRKKVAIAQPHLISKYNSHMGGTDRMDQNVAQYRINMRSKKWRWPFFAHCADVAMQNAWLVYRQSESHKWMPLDQLEFHRAVCKTYFARYTVSRVAATEPLRQPKRLKHRVFEEVRFDGLNHVIATGGTQRRCRWCSKKVTHVCTKCDTGLHVWCFAQFHKKQ